MTLFLKGATYPLELLADAQRLAQEASKHICTDGRNTTTPEERTFARVAIFTAFNFVESLLTELTQICLEEPSTSQEVKAEIQSQLSKGRAKISNTIKEWPEKLGKKSVHDLPEFSQFEKLRKLRNNLNHPKLEHPDGKGPTQDELLQQASAVNAFWAASEVKKMGRVLYHSYGFPIPPEVECKDSQVP